METKGIGIIGCGGRIRGLVELVPGLGKDIRITALCDPSRKATQQTRDTVASDARVYHDYTKLVQDPKVDWVFIGSWNCSHREHAIAALEAGKHVFCEKPLATTFEDCMALKRARDKTPELMFVIGFTLRYSAHYRRIKELVADGHVGQIMSMEFNEVLHYEHGGYIHGDWRRLRELAGTHLLEKCCHDIDLAHWIVDSLPARVASFGGVNFFKPANRKYIEKLGPHANGRKAFNAWSRPKDYNPFTSKKDVLDNQVAILEFANEARATFHTNCSANIPERRMYICGTEGTLRADLLTGKLELCAIAHDATPEIEDSAARGGHGGGDEILGEELAEAIHKGAEPSTCLEDGLTSAITCFGIDKACDTGRVVNMAPMWKRAKVQMR